MQVHKIKIYKKIFLLAGMVFAMVSGTKGQISNVEFGKNRLQFKKFAWDYLQTSNFDVYYNKGGKELAKFALQVAEENLPQIEKFVEYSLQQKANIIVYNNFNDMQASNIGLGIDWQNTGGTTTLVNNKVIVYFNGDHADFKKQIREGLAAILTQNILFGDDIGEVAGNKALLDLPKWLTDGYIAYVGQNWNTKLDDQLKNEILSGKYSNFNQLAFKRPLLAGHAFWYFIEEKYKKETTTYLLYLARMYKSLNKASQEITNHNRFEKLLDEFMIFQEEKYSKDVARRKNYPKGSMVTTVPVGERVDYFHFNVNPNKRDGTFGVVQYKKGQYKLILSDGYRDETLLKMGSRTRMNEINPNYPVMTWDPRGNRLAVIYEEEGKLKLFLYDVISKTKQFNRDLSLTFDQVQDVKFMPDNKNLLLSAVKNGHTDLYTYDIENQKAHQITNDIFDDLDPTFVDFRGRKGIIFSSNRPSPDAKGGDTSLLNNKYNIFLIRDYSDTKTGINQITQLTNLKYGDARYPALYDNDHFTFITDENGIANRYAGFFSSQNDGLDTLVLIGDEVFRNPTANQVDSTLKALQKSDVDSIAVVSIAKDSTYIFPITNYATSLQETREAGDNNQVSEVTQQYDYKNLYKLKIDGVALSRRNVPSRPSTYMKRVMENERLTQGQQIIAPSSPVEDIFQNQFKTDSAKNNSGEYQNTPDTSGYTKKYSPRESRKNVLDYAKNYTYKPLKFSTDYVVAGLNNTILGTRFQTYAGGVGPISLTSNNGLNGIIRMGIADVMEDIKISGGFRLSSNFKDNDWLFEFKNLRKRIDWGLSYYRNSQQIGFVDTSAGQYLFYPGKLMLNLYQGNISYPFDATKSIRLTAGVRFDNPIVKMLDENSAKAKFPVSKYSLAHLEYVYDNTLNPTMNIWDGIRYRAYIDWNTQLNEPADGVGKNTYNFGFEIRGYYPIYRNFIWAGRVASDFSWGNQKLIYYLGGIDNWLMLGNNVKVDQSGTESYRYFNPSNHPADDQNYAFQTLAGNLRGFIQNAANGNNAVVINSEFRLPVFTTLLNKPVNSAFLRNFQLTQFIDLGTAWNGKYDQLKRPTGTYVDPTDPVVSIKINPGGVGPFLGGYGFGARTTVFGYFLKLDAGWPMNGFFSTKPIYYISMGLDF